MNRSLSQSAVARARWLAELAAALDEAHRLSLEMAQARPDIPEAVTLRIRILALRAEVENLRLGDHLATRDHDLIWPIHLHWR